MDALNSGEPVTRGGEVHQFMHGVSQEALVLTAQLNGSYHPPEEVRKLFAQLIGRPVDDSFTLFPPFYADCGKNIHVGKGVFLNMGCKFQDQGGIFIGDGTFIGHNVVLATLNHAMDPSRRSTMLPAPIHIGKRVWMGANAAMDTRVKATVTATMYDMTRGNTKGYFDHGSPGLPLRHLCPGRGCCRPAAGGCPGLCEGLLRLLQNGARLC